MATLVLATYLPLNGSLTAAGRPTPLPRSVREGEASMRWRHAAAPRDKASTARWTRFGMESGSTLIQELHPLAIVVSGNTAVAHYVYSEVTEDSGGEVSEDEG